MTELADHHLKTDPKRVIIAYLILVVAFSSVFWYLIAVKPQWAIDNGILHHSMFLLMWCPGIAALITRFVFQGNFKGMGWKTGEFRWWIIAMIIPVLTGFIMFGTAWVTGIAPFLSEKATEMIALPMMGALITGLIWSIISATGEEIGWRGLLVPELGRVTSFTWVALISAFIWFCWHVPVMLAGGYGGQGGLLYSLIIFFLSMIGGSTLFAWIRLRSGSIWPAALLHGCDNFFTQEVYPSLTAVTKAGGEMLGEFGWYMVLISLVIGVIFWYLRFMLPPMPKPEGGL